MARRISIVSYVVAYFTDTPRPVFLQSYIKNLFYFNAYTYPFFILTIIGILVSYLHPLKTGTRLPTHQSSLCLNTCIICLTHWPFSLMMFIFPMISLSRYWCLPLDNILGLDIICITSSLKSDDFLSQENLYLPAPSLNYSTSSV